MSYQVLARKWRPQRFDEVIGQRGVTQTLRNAIASGRVGQSFVFAGPRGVGKTTTARILAKCLNCFSGPTENPCGECDACIEIAQGRDLDVIEIDAASNTGVQNVRDVIIENLSIRSARDRNKIFIIDEVHRLSQSAFDALLKSIEEPPPHVVFMMATTEIDKVPATVQSRSQVFELKTIGLKQIAEQLRAIADAEGLHIDDAALMLIARTGDGSMRDAQSALDQVIAFAGSEIRAEDVAVVLGLVQRDLLFDIIEAVAQEDASALFSLAGRAVESGYDMRSIVRELARLTRDLLLVKIDPSRASDPEIAAEGERDRMLALAPRFSTEDLMRAFDVLTKAELDIRGAAQPRYHLEMALLRWVHLRKLVPLSDLIQGLDKGGPPSRPPSGGGFPARQASPAARVPAAPTPRTGAPESSTTGSVRAVEAQRQPARPPASTPAPSPASTGTRAAEPAQLKEAFLDEIRKGKKFFYGAVVAMAQKIEVEAERIAFTYGPHHRTLRAQLEQTRPYLEDVASRVAGRRMTVVGIEGTPVAPSGNGGSTDSSASADSRQDELKRQAMQSPAVQEMLDVFGAEIRDVEER